MKKLFHKLTKRNNSPPPSRITSETIDQHREHILAGGRRFKYPIQYARHKLVINAIIISITAVVIAVAIGWWQLYPGQNTSDFMYRITRVVPLPVAVVDGQSVQYSDYLMAYRSSVYYLEKKEQVNLKTDDGKRQIDYIKQKSMQGAIEDAYAVKLAKKLGISISGAELETFIKGDRQSVNGEVSEQTYYAVILDYYNWSPDEYRHVTENKLLRQKVAYAMDKNSLKAADSVNDIIKKDPISDFKSIASTISSQTGLKVTHGVSGWVPKANRDGGLAIEASKLKKLEASFSIKSTKGDGYYVVRQLDINSNQVSYEYINIPLTTFTKSLDDVISKGKVQKYISIANIAN